LGGIQTLSTIEGEGAGMPKFVHTLLELAGELSIILNNKNSHRRIPISPSYLKNA